MENASHSREKLDTRSLQLIALPASLGVGDIAITLLMQPHAYWQGSRLTATDFNPIVVAALQVSPWLAIPAAVGWSALIAVSMVTLPPSLRRKLFLFLTVAHLVCIWGWIARWDVRVAIASTLVACIVGWIAVAQTVRDIRNTVEPEII